MTYIPLAQAQQQFIKNSGTKSIESAPTMQSTPQNGGSYIPLAQAQTQFLKSNPVKTPTAKVVTPKLVQQQPQPKNLVQDIQSVDKNHVIGSVAKSAMKTIQNLPEAHFADKANFFTPVGFVKSVAQGLINTPAEAAKGALDIGVHAQAGNSTPQQVAGDLAAAVQLPLLFLTGGESSVVKEGVEQTVKNVATQGIKEGAKDIAKNAAIGGGFGVLGGLQSGKNITNPKDYVKNLLQNIGIGAAGGSILSTAGKAVSIAIPLAKGLSAKNGAIFVKDATSKEPVIDHVEVSPQVAQSTVINKPELENTEVGKAILKESLIAKKTGDNVAITPAEDGKYSMPSGGKVNVESVAPYDPEANVKSFTNHVQEYRTNGGFSEGTKTENASLRDAAALADRPEVVEHTQSAVKEAIDNGEMKTDDNGDITLYRGGNPNDVNKLSSATYDKSVAQTFADNAGGTLHEFKVKPEDIKAFIGKDEKEVLVKPESVVKEPEEKVSTSKGAISTDKEYQDYKLFPKRTIITSYEPDTYKGIRPENIVHFNQGANERVTLIVRKGEKEIIQLGSNLKKMVTGKLSSGGRQDLNNGIKRIASLNKVSEGEARKIIKDTYDKYRAIAKENADKNNPTLVNTIDDTGKKATKSEEKVVEKDFTPKKAEQRVLNTKETKELQQVISAKFDAIGANAHSPEEFLTGAEAAYKDISKRAGNDKVVLSALRTRLSKEMYQLAGATGDNYKENYKALQTVIKEDPETGKIVSRIEDMVHELDEKLLTAQRPEKVAATPLSKVEKTSQKGEPTNQQPVGTGKVRESSAYKRLVQNLEKEDPEAAKPLGEGKVTYNRVNLQDQAEKAIKLIEKDPQKAYDIAKGYENPPDGMLQRPIVLALADRAREEKNWRTFADLESSGSLTQTRHGQEIVVDRGRFNDNSTHTYVSQLLDARLRALGKSKITEGLDAIKEAVRNTVSSGKKNAIAKIDKGTVSLQKEVKRKQAKITSAQSILDALTCK